jgi:hypothetical protein
VILHLLQIGGAVIRAGFLPLAIAAARMIAQMKKPPPG